MDDQEPEPTGEAEPAPGREARRRAQTLDFLREVAVLLIGLFIGFFWSQYFQQVGDEGHIIIALLIIILILVRYIYMITRP